jgi:hypothetical protein
MQTQATLRKIIVACELQVWQALVDGDQAADKKALAGDFLGVYSDGFATRSQHVAQLAHGPTVRQFAVSQERIKALGPNHVMLSYLAEFVRQGADLVEAMYVSSIWARQGDGWVNVFSQDTPAVGN